MTTTEKLERIKTPRRSFTEQNLPDNVTDADIDALTEPEEIDEDKPSPYELACERADAERDREKDERNLE